MEMEVKVVRTKYHRYLILVRHVLEKLSLKAHTWLKTHYALCELNQLIIIIVIIISTYENIKEQSFHFRGSSISPGVN